jgi:DNA-binding GntR family transcriptional regulator
MVARTDAKQTRAESVRNRMRHDILSGVMKPGQRLVFPDLCEQYGASVGVTREALAGLVSQGLVRAVAHHGHTVTPISSEDLRHLVAARLLIEPQVIHMSVSNGGLEWESRLVAAYHRMSRTPRLLDDDPSRPSPEWAQVHEAFHQALFAACGNPRLLEIAAQLGADAVLYRRWSDTLNRRDDDAAAEHAALLDAAVAGDAERAARVLRQHIERTVSTLVLEVGDQADSKVS